MKIAVFTDTFLPQVNGVTNTLSRLGQYLDHTEHEYIFLAPEFEEKEEGLYSYNVERFFSLKFILYPECRISFPTTRKLDRVLDAFQPDIIQCMTEFNMGVSGLGYAKKRNIPVVTNYTTNFYKYLKYYNLSFLENVCWKYMQWFHNQSNQTLCPSNNTIDVLEKNGIENVGLFGRGVDCQQFSPTKRSDTLRKTLGIDDKLAFLYVGRVSVEKDLDILFKAYNRLQETHGKEIALIITGDGPMLEKYANTYKEGIIYTGYQSGEKLAEMYASADIFAFPSPTETLGNVVIEAMASSLPVIAVNEGGVKQNLRDQYNGIGCKEKDVDDFYNGMLKMVEDSAYRQQIGKQARAYALTNRWEKVFEDLLTTYERVIGEKKQRITSIA